MCVNINKVFNVLCSQSLCEVVVNSCHELQSKSSVVFRVFVLPVWNLLSIAVLEFVPLLLVLY